VSGRLRIAQTQAIAANNSSSSIDAKAGVSAALSSPQNVASIPSSIGTTLIWVKKNDHTFGTFLSDAEIGWMKGGHGVYCKRVIFQPPTRAKEGGGAVAHPTQKPIALMRWCIERLKLKPGTTIFDPYMGSGTTGVAAAQMGLPFIGCEIDPGYFEVARRRIDAALASAPLFSGAAP
jgi:site-specific DNA-methyltransferase (adenine-specific)